VPRGAVALVEHMAQRPRASIVVLGLLAGDVDDDLLRSSAARHGATTTVTTPSLAASLKRISFRVRPFVRALLRPGEAGYMGLSGPGCGRIRTGTVQRKLPTSGVDPIQRVKLVKHVAVDAEGHGRVVPGLACDVDHALSFCDQEGHKRVAQVVWARIGPASSSTGVLERAATPVPPIAIRPKTATDVWEHEALLVGGTLGCSVLVKILDEGP
jgi:hypothetical protein